jgi:FMN phosphatase YigB (HAD superfamily)
MVGNSPRHDIAGAQSAGLKGILVTRMQTNRDQIVMIPNDGGIPDLTHLEEALKRFSVVSEDT